MVEKKEKKERHIRYVDSICDVFKTKSIETFDKFDRSGSFDRKDFDIDLWEKVHYPDFPKGIKDLDEFEYYKDDLVRKAHKGNKKAQFELLRGLEGGNYSVEKDKKLGVILQANGVNANPKGIMMTDFMRYKMEIEGDYQGENIFGDGDIIANPKVKTIIDKQTGKRITIKKAKQLAKRCKD